MSLQSRVSKGPWEEVTHDDLRDVYILTSLRIAYLKPYARGWGDGSSILQTWKCCQLNHACFLTSHKTIVPCHRIHTYERGQAVVLR